jgi:hypothetical protein
MDNVQNFQFHQIKQHPDIVMEGSEWTLVSFWGKKMDLQTFVSR